MAHPTVVLFNLDSNSPHQSRSLQFLKQSLTHLRKCVSFTSFLLEQCSCWLRPTLRLLSVSDPNRSTCQCLILDSPDHDSILDGAKIHPVPHMGSVRQISLRFVYSTYNSNRSSRVVPPALVMRISSVREKIPVAKACSVNLQELERVCGDDC